MPIPVSGGSRVSVNSLASRVSPLKLICGNDSETKRGKRIQMMKMLFIPMIPVAALLVQTIANFVSIMDLEYELRHVQLQIRKSDSIKQLIHALELERSYSVLYLSLVETVPRESMLATYENTDKILSSMTTWRSLNIQHYYFKTKPEFKEYLQEHRQHVLAFKSSIAQELVTYSAINEVLMELSLANMLELDGTYIWPLLMARKLMVRAKDHYGALLAVGSFYFIDGFLDHNNFTEFIYHDTLAMDYLEMSFNLFDETRDLFYNWARATNDTKIFGELRQTIILNNVSSHNHWALLMWFNSATEFTNHLHNSSMYIEVAINNIIDEMIINSNAKVAVYVIILVIVLAVTPILFVSVHVVTSALQNYATGLKKRTRELKEEKRRSDRLLYQMLPRTVAEQLKMGGKVEATAYDSVTVYFSDIVGFTEICATSSPMQVICFLNKLYNYFDAKIEKYEVYKIETIGDAYMVVSGLPKQNGNRHSGEIASMALDVLAGVKTFTIPHQSNVKMQLRTGIHTGPCAAGVVGSKMPRYCLFGDTVNFASRMESTSLPSRIHISESCKLSLEESGGYLISKRGVIDIKGKGPANTYWLQEWPTLVESSSPGVVPWIEPCSD